MVFRHFSSNSRRMISWSRRMKNFILDRGILPGDSAPIDEERAMFSASLLSMMIHSLGAPLMGTRSEASYGDPPDFINFLRQATTPNYLPVVLWSKRSDGLDSFKKYAPNALAQGPVAWGRLPVVALVALYADRFNVSPQEELFDLGAPLSPLASVGNTFVTDCANLLAKAPGTQSSVAIAVIDRGDVVAGATPEDFNSRLRHSDKNGIELSDHATKVLWVLVNELDGLGILPECELL